MKSRHFGAILGLVAMLSGCGGSGDTLANGGGGGGGTPTPTPTTTGCSLRERQDWAAAQLNEWYLFPETLPTNLNPSAYSTVEAYIDALTATARSQRRDRYFTYLTSIAEENAYYNSGATAGFGFRLGYDTAARRVAVIQILRGCPGARRRHRSRHGDHRDRHQCGDPPHRKRDHRRRRERRASPTRSAPTLSAPPGCCASAMRPGARAT